VPPADAAPPPTDGTVPPADAAPPLTDGTVPPTDGTVLPADAAPPPTDGTVPPADAAPRSTDGAPPSTDATPPPADGGVAAPPEPPGTNSPSSAGPGVGHGGLDIAANAGFAGTLFYNHRHVAGEPSVSGMILVAPTGTHGSGVPPDDTVVTINGVPLVHANLAASARYFIVDPAGQQPVLGSDGFLHVSAASASTDASRDLNLACPFALAATLTPRPGALPEGTGQIQLAWPAGSLPVQARDYSAFGLMAPSVTLRGFELATQVLSFISNSQPVAPDATGAIVPLRATTASGYAVDVSFPGIFFVDGETAGVCGRIQPFVYSK
jgi:hypothetical protein